MQAILRAASESMKIKHLWAVLLVVALAACASPSGPAVPESQQITRLLPADAILIGEQHDAPDHQRIHRLVVETLSGQRVLAALALEMATEGQSTEKLAPDADEALVRSTLQWSEGAWSWDSYGPIVMAAVRAGVPVVGANLPRARLRETMADAGFEQLLPESALKVLQQRIRVGHCDRLPESQVGPMTRVQIARDISMAQTVVRLTRPGKTVLLLAGSGHVDRTLGVPLHLPASLKAKTVLLHGEALPEAAAKGKTDFDQFWATRPAPPTDYCASFTARQPTPAAVPGAPAKAP